MYIATLSLPLMHAISFQSPSQIAREGPQAIAEALSSNLRRTGDLELAEPNLVDLCVVPCELRWSTETYTKLDQPPNRSDRRRDDDQIMMTATNHTQFAKTLLLFVCRLRPLYLEGFHHLAKLAPGHSSRVKPRVGHD